MQYILDMTGVFAKANITNDTDKKIHLVDIYSNIRDSYSVGIYDKDFEILTNLEMSSVDSMKIYLEKGENPKEIKILEKIWVKESEHLRMNIKIRNNSSITWDTVRVYGTIFTAPMNELNFMIKS